MGVMRRVTIEILLDELLELLQLNVVLHNDQGHTDSLTIFTPSPETFPFDALYEVVKGALQYRGVQLELFPD